MLSSDVDTFFIDGSVVSSNPSGGKSDAGMYLNLSCPQYYTYYSPSSCSIQFNNTLCTNNMDSAVLYCYDGKDELMDE